MSEATSAWDGARVRQLRDALGDSQQAFADRLGTRQQTVSEWERGASRPRRMAQRLLTMLAEEHARYAVEADSQGEPPAGDARGGTRR
ncbi:MAG: helix-turn-helix domain-containing protein [Dehalococcoidia bacterium]